MEEIEKICIYYLKSINVTFIENVGKYTICKYNGEEYKWIRKNPYKLYHKNKWMTLDFFNEIRKIKTFKKAWQNKCSKDLENILYNDDKEIYDIHVNTPVLSYHDKEVKDFLSYYDNLVVQSPMATQKTNIIKECINQSNQKNLRTLIITTRISLAKESYMKYKDMNFKLYSDNDYQNENLIVQFDSLYKYDIHDFDVVIIDEITSLLLYITSPYPGKEDIYRKNIQILFNIQAKIMLLDAFIIHNPFGGKSLTIHNEFRENLKVIEYNTKRDFETTINRYSNRFPISVSSNEKRFLVKLKTFLEKYNKRVLLLTADTENKDEILQMLQNSSGKTLKDIGYDVLLYSPVVTVGISIFFEIEHHFHFDNSRSIDPVNSIQMIRRMRNAKVIHYFIQGKLSYKSTDKIKIRNHKILDYFRMYNIRGDDIGITDAGKKLMEILRIKHVFENTHKYAFRELMKYQFKEVEVS